MVPNSFLNNFGKFLKKTSGSFLKMGIWVRGWGKISHGRARVRELLAGLGQGMLNWSVKLRLGKGLVKLQY